MSEEREKAGFECLSDFMTAMQQEGGILERADDPYGSHFIVATALKTVGYPIEIQRVTDEETDKTSLLITFDEKAWKSADALLRRYDFTPIPDLINNISEADPTGFSNRIRGEKPPSNILDNPQRDHREQLYELPVSMAKRAFMIALDRWLQKVSQQPLPLLLDLYQHSARRLEEDKVLYEKLKEEDVRPFTPEELGMITTRTLQNILQSNPQLRHSPL